MCVLTITFVMGQALYKHLCELGCTSLMLWLYTRALTRDMRCLIGCFRMRLMKWWELVTEHRLCCVPLIVILAVVIVAVVVYSVSLSWFNTPVCFVFMSHTLIKKTQKIVICCHQKMDTMTQVLCQKQRIFDKEKWWNGWL